MPAPTITQKQQARQGRWLRVLNNSSANTIPAFGLVRVVSVDGTGLFTVDQPSADSQDVMIVSNLPINPGGYGSATRDFPAFAAYDTGGTPAAGQTTWGAANGSYLLTAAKAGFTTLGAGVGTGALSRVLVQPTNTSGGAGGGSGTVTSVGLTAPAEFAVAGSPVNTAGTLAITKASQNPNTFWGGPASGGAAQPTFRALGAADLPLGTPQSLAKITKLYSDFTAAGTGVTITLTGVVPQKSAIFAVFAKHSLQFTGPGLTQLAILLQTNAAANLTTVLDGSLAVSDSNYVSSSGNTIVPYVGSFTAGSYNLKVNVNATGCNLNQLTAGSVDFWIVTIPLA